MFSSYDLKSFGLALKRIRKQLSFTQNMVTEKTQISRDTLRRIENGSVVPRFETLERLSVFYKVDLLEVLSQHRADVNLRYWYDEFDNLIAKYDESKLKALSLAIKEYTSENYNSFIVHEEVEQCLTFLKAIELYFSNFENEKMHIEQLLIQCMRITLSDFDIKQFKKYRYNIIETRILLLLSLTYGKVDNFQRSNEILLFLSYRQSKNKILPPKLVIAIYTNLAYNYHMQDRHKDVINICDKGIEYAISADTFSNLYLIYFRKGIAEFNLNLPEYITSLTLSVSILKILGQNSLYELYLSVLENKYHIILPSF